MNINKKLLSIIFIAFVIIISLTVVVYADDEMPPADTAVEMIILDHADGWSWEGDIWYYYSNNSAVTGWRKISGEWYFFNPDGAMLTGWQLIDGDWYYMSGSGEMQTGWLQRGGIWYYLRGSGEMVIGWEKINGSWYYFKDSGAMATGWVLDGNTWYCMYGSGEMRTGWYKSGNTWYYLRTSGAMATGWEKVNGSWYYFKDSGAMATGWVLDGSTWYYMYGSGEMKTGWLQRGNTWYYLKSSGAMATGWEKVNGSWYYFNDSGAMTTSWQRVGGEWYFLSDSGAMVTGWLKRGNTWYYLKSSGVMATGWLTINGTLYCFDDSGAMKDGKIKIAICGTYTSETYQVDDDVWQLMEDLGAVVTKVSSSVDVSRYDGLLIPGGIDIDPSLYGERDYACDYTDIDFDREQLAIIDKFVSAGKPVLGICRGCELLNIYFEGSLTQDISGHRSSHKVTALSGSKLASVCGSNISVSSAHHQALKSLGSGLTATEWAPDNTVEGIEHGTLPIIGVMWHPEWSSSVGRALIEYFVYTMCAS